MDVQIDRQMIGWMEAPIPPCILQIINPLGATAKEKKKVMESKPTQAEPLVDKRRSRVIRER